MVGVVPVLPLLTEKNSIRKSRRVTMGNNLSELRIHVVRDYDQRQGTEGYTTRVVNSN